LGGTRQKLLVAGVEMLAVMATDPERARLYFRFRPPGLPVGADPELVTHRLYGLPNPAVAPVTPQVLEAYRTTYVNPTGDLPRPMPVLEASHELNRIDGHELVESDQAELERHFPLGAGQFLVDRGGIVRWVNIEGAQEGLAGAGKFPTDEELLAVARALAGGPRRPG
jgi:hypothetical protein